MDEEQPARHDEHRERRPPSGAPPAPVGFAALAVVLAEVPELDEILGGVAAPEGVLQIVRVPTWAESCTASRTIRQPRR